MSDLLSSLTAERLDEDAAWYSVRAAELRADAKDSPAPDCRVMRDRAAMFERAAATYEALAKAERAMRRMAPDMALKIIAGDIVADYLSDRHGLRRTGEIGRGPTLLAALGSVGQQTKG